jgi:predicted extracellular nuclease
MKNLVLAFLFVAVSALALAQNPQNRFVIVFYNVENLFDTIPDARIDDAEFLPSSEKQWNTKRYDKKIDDLARVLSGVATDELPEIIGLAEVENRRVLEDLVKSSRLAPGLYSIVHKDSPDPRGIDVALLFRRDVLKSVVHEIIPVTFPFDSSRTTRDILYVKGQAEDGGNLHFFVNHWSSRVGGERQTENLRMYCAVALRRRIDILLAQESDPRIVVMGDFNDEPTNRSIMGILQASNKRKNVTPGDLYGIFYERHNEESYGSYFYQGNWNMLDQIIISHNLLNQKGRYSASYTSGDVLREDWMMFKNSDGVLIPNRTYSGSTYLGGVSDHLPVYLFLEK